MKVIDNALTGIRFDSLGMGATFKYGDNYYIVIEARNDTAPNAVNLEHGTLSYFGANHLVIPFNCELIIL